MSTKTTIFATLPSNPTSRGIRRTPIVKAAFTAVFIMTNVVMGATAHASSSHLLSEEFNFSDYCGNDRDCRIELSRRSTLVALQKASQAHEDYIKVIDREGSRICTSSTIAMDFLHELTGSRRISRAQRYTLSQIKGARNKTKALAKAYKRKGDKRSARKFKKLSRKYNSELRRHKRVDKIIKAEFQGIGTRTQQMRCGRFAPKNH